MHIEIQVALNFVISYLYNKLPRRRVNIFGEELEKALKHKFQGHWYPDKPFKGSAFRCLKTGEPIDVVLEIAARESGVPIGDILENLPAELSVWVDPGEVSYRIGEKGAVKILYSEQKNDSPDDNNADREVTTTFNPEAQCFRPIEILSSSLNGMTLTLSPKSSPNDSSPTSSTSPMYKNNSPCNGSNNGSNNATTFLGRQEPVLFTTATFAQTKFGSTKLKNNSKRNNSRMSPTEFSNYIKQRQQLQQHNNHYHHQNNHHQGNLFGAIGSVSPARSISPNPMTLQMTNDSSMHQNPFVFPSSNGFNGLNMYQSYGSPRNMFENGLNGSNGGNIGNFNQFNNGNNDSLLFTPGKCSSFMDQQSNFCKIPSQQQQQQQNSQSSLSTSSTSQIGNNGTASNGVGAIGTPSNQQQQPSQSDSSKLLDGMNSFYNNNSNSSYQHHLLVAN
ncbi:hypothetical protein PVAND_013190 [Polypedilum vanderplanki]|uniref:Anti-proliferative protein domain-containing protein n=1 Tax=Polypedilum vanderplanki TaxID=319348 RepID=A0A9J6CQP3_POLVA|nr:hypothetical protein PVAND_013190 [Polypedilum vanderplanki]